MEIQEIVDGIQNFRAQLDTWGITPEGLIAVAAIASILFFLSLREVALWYLKVSHLRGDVRELRAEIAELKTLMTEKFENVQICKASVTEAPAEEPARKQASTEVKQEAPVMRFPLDH